MQDYNTIIGAIQMRLNKCPIVVQLSRQKFKHFIMNRYL